MNFVLIQFLATSVVGISLGLQALLLQGLQEWQTNKEWNIFNFTFGVHKTATTMERVEDKQSAQGHKGLQQRRSYMSLSEQEQAGVLQAVDMRRTGSNQSTSSQKTESSIMKDSSEDQIPGQPINFGMVVPGVYRSSYPKVADYPFLQQLKLKTIM